MSRSEILASLKDFAVVPVVRTPSEAMAETVIEWLAAAGMQTVEVTLTTPGAITLIGRLRTNTNLLVGAGTVRSESDAARACGAGAHYLVSPAFVAGMTDRAAAADVPCVMGAFTPTEIATAHAAGADAVKVFPVSSGGGASYIRALRSVFPDIVLAPTGGITPETVAEFLTAGAAFVGVGGNLVNTTAIADGRRDIVEAAARTALASVQTARNQEREP